MDGSGAAQIGATRRERMGVMLRFFATNRAMDRLGRAVDKGNDGRLKRLALSKGGYYFVDMEQYMRFYLATTDADQMPRGAVVQDSKESVFDNFLSDPRIRAIVVCVHGFNVDLFEASTWFRILTDTMKHTPDIGERIVTSPADLRAKKGDAAEKKGGAAERNLTAFIGFSWPSNGSVLSYLSDQQDAADSKGALASLVARLKAMTGKSVNLLCHSMGNYLACHMFAALVDDHIVPAAAVNNHHLMGLLERGKRDHNTENVERDSWLVDNYVMLAPDVERRHVTKCAGGNVETDYVGRFHAGLQHLVHRKVNFYSRFDSALSISNIEKAPRKAVAALGDAVGGFLGLDALKRDPHRRWEKRLGEAPAPSNAAPGFESVNATELAGRKIDHSDHIDSRPVAERIAKELGVCEP